MDLVNTNDENSFDPTPKLKSSPIPITFVSFNNYDYNCIYCGKKYTMAIFSHQKYCKKCLSRYITDISDNVTYLDVHYTMKKYCIEHKMRRTKEPQNIQECCTNCLEILLFKQIPVCDLYSRKSIRSDYTSIFDNVFKSEKYCKLCEKSLYQGTDIYKFKLCSDCYRISSGWIESTLTKKLIPIIYLPWWDNSSYCRFCKSNFIFTSDCQKYCMHCFIFYIGCRYCLTTNVIFGLTDQSQCKKCERILSIINFSSGNSDLDHSLLNLKLNMHNNLKIDEFVSIVKNIDRYFVPIRNYGSDYILSSIYSSNLEQMIGWLPYSYFTNVKKIAEGGFSIIYQATWLGGQDKTVILKRIKNSQGISKEFLNELKSIQSCYKIKHHIIEPYGVTKDPDLEDYILVMQYASKGDLHNYLQKDFTNITWNKQKLLMLWQISEGLETIHNADFIHRDLHSGNILYVYIGLYESYRNEWKIGDLGLSQPANNTSSNNEIYGVIPYVAPEVFKGSTFSKESDVYSMGMIMWELTTGCKPFANVKHDIHLVYKILDGERPKITEDTPKCYADLMKSCLDLDPKKRPSVTEIHKTFSNWLYGNINIEQFNQAEIKREELINSKKLGPEFAEKPHPDAIYTSGPLSSFISKCSSINSSLKDYTSIELGFDISFSSPSPNLNSTIQNSSTILHPNAIHTSNLNPLATVATSLKKRNIKESDIDETHNNNNGKHIKSSSN
ncbi:kinase-like domain-containing protein [Glomus cerebriforme]|uniref:Kinase-like domain-containing protein n=1 Tax=Glomus cerebriforme TaxID=658196 RepID=A0A397S448_9GLOM|nr:kinase-like domain-containing protein [Glomus cerebriforme]